VTYAEAITYPAGLTVGQTYQVRLIASPTGFVRIYDPTLGGTVAAGSVNLPTLTAVYQVTQETQQAVPGYPSSGFTNGVGVMNGPIKCKVVAAAADTVNGSSVTAPLWIGPDDVLILATG
jgi:hypothetical protein